MSIAGASVRLVAAEAPESAGSSSLAGQPVLGRNANGVLEVFQVAADGQLRHRWQKPSNGDWSSWSTLGSGVSPGIAIANFADGRMAVFAEDSSNHTLRYICQRETNSLNWSDWTDLGGKIRAPLAAGQDADGRLEVFAFSMDGSTVKHIWQTNAQNGWSAWSDLGGAVQSQLAAIRSEGGRLELFGIAAGGGQVLHCWEQRLNASGDWSRWVNLGGNILPGFAVEKNAVGHVELFAVNQRHAGVRIYQINPGDSQHWTGWLSFGDEQQITNAPASRDIPGNWRTFGSDLKPGLATAKSKDGRLEVYAVNAVDGSLLHRWETLHGGSDRWSPWATMDEKVSPYPAAGANEDGNLEVFAADPRDANVIHHRRQISFASDWLDWSRLDAPTFQYASRTWRTDEGLPGNTVQAIAQTADGYLWIGTQHGLARFDGVQFTAFNTNNTPQLKNSSITALWADRTGVLWIGTDGGGLVRLMNGVFSRFGKTNGLAGENVRVISEGTNGSLWIGTTTGLSRYEGGQFHTYTQAQGLSSDVVRNICEDRGGNLWIATGKGLNRLRPGGTMDSFTMPNGLPNDSVRGICQDKGGRIWIGSNNGLLWYNWYWGQSFYAYNTRYGLSDTFVSAICEDREGNLWVGTYSGLNRFREGRFYSQLDDEGSPFGRVNAMFEDREGDMWVGTTEGLVRLTPKRFFAYTRQQGLTHNNVTSVMEDSSGSLWLGTWGGGLNEMKDEKVTDYAPTNGLSQDLILSLCESDDGSLWVGADFDGGLTRLKNGVVTHYTWTNGLINAGLRALHEDRNGNLWIGTMRGLSCFENGKFANYTTRDGLAGNAVHAICEDHAGNLWFGTDGGLSRWNNGTFVNLTTRNGLSQNLVTALYEDEDGVLWIGTASGGLNRYADGKFTSYTMRQGLFSDEIFSILEDREGWLWMSCSKGVFRVSKQVLNDYAVQRAKRIVSIAYGKTDGMETPQCNGIGSPAAWRDRDGRLWFATTKGVVEVDPATVRIDRKPPPIYVEQVLADRVARLPVERRTSEEPLVIPPGRGELEFHYAALSLSAPEKNRFKYKLDSVDSDWVDAGARRTAYYNNVSPGRYTFHVIGCNKDGIWNETGASLEFILKPYFWQTWWFRGLLAGLILGGASGAVLYATRRRMQRKLELVEQRHAIEKERGRIAKDIHDDLGSSLTRIMMLGERVEEGLGRREDIAPQVNKIVSSARHTLQSLDEIVWAVNPENDTLNGLLEYIGHYANEFFENTRLSCRLELPPELPEFNLAAEVRHNLFLVVKEALHNALKHSGATEVRVDAAVKDAALEIVVADNGRGFELNGNGGPGLGNGLRNMRNRMEHLGGHCEISSAPGQGTSLKFILKLKSSVPGSVLTSKERGSVSRSVL
ncbi:MAG TPA: two-component regulator propeller domain-containing protein [Candidatus Angelobacter sp.]|nr:two-component regulator propeller domain-containing protein [Candidatus Angelobacter sp.]